MEETRALSIAIVGNVDTGKTTFSDKLRKSNIQVHEHGHITQNNGATRFTTKAINKMLISIKKKVDHPGFVLIDTPGHEPFDTFRRTAIEIADFIIVVVNIKKGVEKQTSHILKTIQELKKPFIIAANMIDTIDGWKSDTSKLSVKSKNIIARQTKIVCSDFKKHMNNIIATFASEEINAADFNDKKDPREWTYIVPTSARTNEGIAELIYYMCEIQMKYMKKKFVYDESKTKAHVMDVGEDIHGKFMRVILSNGKLMIGDRMIVNTFDKPSDFTITHIMVPDDEKEMKHKKITNTVSEVRAACGCVIKGKFLNGILPGSKMFKIKKAIMTVDFDKDTDDASIDLIKKYKKLQSDLNKQAEIIKSIVFEPMGVHLNADSYGIVEALLFICKKYHIPVAGISIGNIKKEELIRIAKPVRDAGEDKVKKLYARAFSIILMFGDKKIPSDIEHFAKEQSVKIIQNNVIYDLIKNYSKLWSVIQDKFRKGFPQITPQVKLKIINDDHIFNGSKPLVLGVESEKFNQKVINKFTQEEEQISHNLYKDTLIKAIHTDNDGIKKVLCLGKIDSIQNDGSDIPFGKEGGKFCIKIVQIGDRDEYLCSKTVGHGDFDSTWRLETYLTPKLEKIYDHYKPIFGF